MKKLLSFVLASIFLISFSILGFSACASSDAEIIIDNIIDIALDYVIETDVAPTEDATGNLSNILKENGSYDDCENVALYIHLYGKLPSNYITKEAAEDLGWSGGSVEKYAPGKCIGGSRFGNYEGLLPKKSGRIYYECDIDTLGESSRGAKRIVYSNDGLVYYTDDHYETFTLLYGEE